jgi:hypothetical protein
MCDQSKSLPTNIKLARKKAGTVKHSSLFYPTISEEDENKFNSINARAECLKLFTVVIY